MDTAAAVPGRTLLQLMELPDRCLLVLAQLLAEQDKPSLRALARTCTRLHDLLLHALSADITTQLATTEQHESLLRHLQAHGRLLRSLHLRGGRHGICSLSSPHIQVLPEPAQAVLESLGISCLRVAPDSLLTASMGRLQQLDISDCILTAAAEDSLRAGLVAVGPSLRSLSIRRLLVKFIWMELYAVPFPNAALPSLTGLTRLELCGSVCSSAHLSALLALRELSIQSNGGFDMAAGELPASGQLTSLVFQSKVGHPPGPAECPTMAPAALSRVPALRHLVLCTYVAPDQGGTAGLLAELAKLTALTLLRLGEGPLERPLGARDAAAYASLTASSNLQALTIQEAQMPEGAWQHMFGPRKQLPRLQSLVLSNLKDFQGRRYYEGGDEGVLKAGAMTVGTFAALAASCPGLTYIVLEGMYPPGTPLAPLLTRLTALRIMHIEHAGDADISALAQLPQLGSIGLNDSSLSLEGVLQLTQLTQLTWLVLQVKGREVEGRWVPGLNLGLSNKVRLYV
jgi:hypothetical protein